MPPTRRGSTTASTSQIRNLAALIAAICFMGCGVSADPSNESIGTQRQGLIISTTLNPVGDPYHNINYNTWNVANNNADPNCSAASHFGCEDDGQSVSLGSHLWVAGSNGNFSKPEIFTMQGLNDVMSQLAFQRISSIVSVTLAFYGQSHGGRTCIDVISEIPDRLYFDFTTGVATDNLHMPYTQKQNAAYGPLCWDASSQNGPVSTQSYVLSQNPYTNLPWDKSELAQSMELEFWADLHTPMSSAFANNIGTVSMTVVYRRN